MNTTGLVRRTSGGISVIANAIGRAWMLAANIIMFPVYLRLLGAENFGIVALLVAVTAIVTLFDFGLSPVFARELNHQGRSSRSRLDLLSTAECVYLGIVLAIFAFTLIAPESWLAALIKAQSAGAAEIAPTLRLVLIVASAQLVFNFYIAALGGIERQLQSNAVIVGTGLFRSVGVVVPLLFVPKIEVFLWWQFAVTLKGALLARYLLRLALRPDNTRIKGQFSWEMLRTTIPVARASFLLASAATLNMNLDRIFVGALQGLEQIGEYTIAATFAQLILFTSLPITMTVTPRMVRAITSDDRASFEVLVTIARTAIGLVTAIAVIVLLRHGAQLIEHWSGGVVPAQQVGGYLGWLFLGSAALALSGIWHCVATANQDYSFGSIYIYSVLVVVPLYGFAIASQGARGAAIAWSSTQLIVMLGYRFWVGRRLLRGRKQLATPWLGMATGAVASLIAGSLLGLLELNTNSLLGVVSIIFAEMSLAALIAALLLIFIVRRVDRYDGLAEMVNEQFFRMLRRSPN